MCLNADFAHLKCATLFALSGHLQAQTRFSTLQDIFADAAAWYIQQRLSPLLVHVSSAWNLFYNNKRDQ